VAPPWRFHREVPTKIDKGCDIRYLAPASEVPGMFKLGGDLELFRRLIRARIEGLRNYARACIDALYGNISRLDRGITTISLVRGNALGGLRGGHVQRRVLIAERSAKLGLPKIFSTCFRAWASTACWAANWTARAKRLILSGKVYTAEELYEMGVVDVLAEDLHGEMAVYDYIRKENRAANGYRALGAAKDRVNPIAIGRC
jgi:DSF synthase